MNKKEISLFAALIVTAVFSILSGQLYEAKTIRENTLRLHIIANSNSYADQQQKLHIRDELLKMEDILPTKAQNIDHALSSVKGNLPVIESRINDLLKDGNVNYKARCSVENFSFETTQYDGFVLPKGEYAALTVRLGNAEGKNWWCVMYPALCSQSCGETVLEQSSSFIKTEKLTPRFKVVEIYEDIKNMLRKDKAGEYKNLE